MKASRREFLKTAGLGFAAAGAVAPKAAGAISSNVGTVLEQTERNHPSVFNMCGYRAPRLDRVRLGLIGIGNRGSSAVKRLKQVEGVDFKGLCDVRPERVQWAQRELGAAHGPALYSDGPEAWKAMCERDDIDLIYTCTPWALHTPVAVYAMEHGKHVATEVPAAKTVDECWRLVETSERTRRHCKMLENCCYDFFELLTLNMVRQGFFGEVIHGEGAYLHHHVLEEEFEKEYYSKMWRLEENMARNGNLYPTHGLGPVYQVMGINRGDRLEYLSSASSDDFTMEKMAEGLAAKDSSYRQYVGRKFRGNINTSIIRTVRGKTIMVQHDVSSPEPYSRIYKIQGTRAVAIKYPLPARIAVGDNWASEAQFRAWEDQYTPPLVRKMGELAKQVGGHGGMDFFDDWRMIYCLRHGLPLDHDVYDAAALSVIAPLTEWSVANRSAPINVPDFTNGRWSANKPVVI